EIEDADVGMPQVRDAGDPDVRRNAVLIRQPEQRSSIRNDGMVYRPALFLYLDALQPFREAFRNVLLKESLLGDSTVEPLHGDGPTTNVRQHGGRNHLVIRREFTLRNAVIREQHLFGMRDQCASRTTSRAVLLCMPRNRGCRSLPYFVHSMKPARTTIV